MFYNVYHINNRNRISLFGDYTILEIEAENLFTSKEVFDTFYNLKNKSAIYADKYPDATKCLEFEVFSEPDIYHKGRIETRDVKFLVILPFKATPRTFMKYHFMVVHFGEVLHQKEGHYYIEIKEENDKNIRMNLEEIQFLNGLPAMDKPFEIGKSANLRLNDLMMARESLDQTLFQPLNAPFFSFKHEVENSNNRNFTEITDIKEITIEKCTETDGFRPFAEETESVDYDIEDEEEEQEEEFVDSEEDNENSNNKVLFFGPEIQNFD